MLYNQFITTKNADEAFEHWFGLLSNMGDVSVSRDGDVVGEVINAVTVIEDPTQNIMKNKIRNMPMKYAVGELLWYMSGNKNLSEIQKYTKAWDRMSDDGEAVNSNYGWCNQSKYGLDE